MGFNQKIDKYKEILNWKNVMNESKSILYDIQKEVIQKIYNLEHQIQQRINDLVLQSQEQLDLITITEEIIEKKQLISEINQEQLHKINLIVDEGVDKNISKWDIWKKDNISAILADVSSVGKLIQPLIQFNFENYEIVIENEKTNEKNQIKNQKPFAQPIQQDQLNQLKTTQQVIQQQDVEIQHPKEQIHLFKGHLQQVFSCIQLSDESWVTSSFDGTIKAWNYEDYSLEYTSPTLKTAYNDIVEITNHKLGEESVLIAVSNEDGTIKLFARQKNQWGIYAELPPVKEGTPFHLVYDPKKNVLLYNTQRNGKIIMIYDMNTLKFSKEYPHRFAQSYNGTCIVLQQTDERFLTGDLEGFIYKWAYTSKSPLIKFRAHELCINSICVLKDLRIASCCQEGLIKVWAASLLQTKPIKVFDHKYPFWSLCATNKYLLSGDVEGNLNWHCYETLQIKKSIKAHQGGISMIKETIDNTKVITSSEDYKAKLWSIQ